MYNVSNEYKNTIKSDEQKYDAYLLLEDNTKIEAKGNLASISYEDPICTEENLIGNFIKRKFAINILDDTLNLTEKKVKVFIGLEVVNTFEYVPFGTFKVVKSSENNKGSEESKFDVEDLTYKFNTKVNVEILKTATNIFELYSIICEQVGVEKGNTTFTNSTYELSNIYYDTESTYRDIIMQIAKAAGGNAKIGRDDKLYIKELNMTAVKTVDLNEQFEQKKSDIKCGPINAVVASRIEADDGSTTEDVYARDEESITKNGITELKIIGNDLIDNDRQTAVNNILTSVSGFNYIPTELEIVLDQAIDSGDYIELCDVKTNTKYKTIVQELSFNVDTGLMKISSSMKTQTQTDYAAATSRDKRKRTEIKVNKLDGKITAIVQEQTEQSEKLTKIEQDVNTVSISASNAETKATNAENTANDALSTINTVNDALGDIYNDDKLTPDEKSAVKKEWEAIQTEHSKSIAEASKYGISTDNIITAYNSLNEYLAPLFLNMNFTSDIVGDTFRTKFNTWYSANTDVLNSISTFLSGKISETNSDVAQIKVESNRISNEVTSTKQMLVNDYLNKEQTEALSNSNKEEIEVLKTNQTKAEQDAESFKYQITEKLKNGVETVKNDFVTITNEGVALGDDYSPYSSNFSKQNAIFNYNKNEMGRIGLLDDKGNYGVRFPNMQTEKMSIGQSAFEDFEEDGEIRTGVFV